VVGAHQMGNAVRDDTGFAATCTGKNEKRAFSMLHRLPLARVQTCEKIHESFILARRYNALILKHLIIDLNCSYPQLRVLFGTF